MFLDFFCDNLMYYLGVSRVFQYFSNMKLNLVAPDAFAEAMKMMNNTGLLRCQDYPMLSVC